MGAGVKVGVITGVCVAVAVKVAVWVKVGKVKPVGVGGRVWVATSSSSLVRVRVGVQVGGSLGRVAVAEGITTVGGRVAGGKGFKGL